MEAIIDLLQELHLNMFEVMIAAMFVFCIGYLIGSKKGKKMNEEIYSLQRQVLELNSELLYGKTESETKTPVIEIKHDQLKNGKIANQF